MVLIPGGFGTRPLMHNETIKNWVKAQFEQVELMLSVCTGSLVLATSGLLENIAATTHHAAFDELAKVAPNTKIIRGTKYVDNGRLIIWNTLGMNKKNTNLTTEEFIQSIIENNEKEIAKFMRLINTR